MAPPPVSISNYPERAARRDICRYAMLVIAITCTIAWCEPTLRHLSASALTIKADETVIWASTAQTGDVVYYAAFQTEEPTETVAASTLARLLSVAGLRCMSSDKNVACRVAISSLVVAELISAGRSTVDLDHDVHVTLMNPSGYDDANPTAWVQGQWVTNSRPIPTLSCTGSTASAIEQVVNTPNGFPCELKVDGTTIHASRVQVLSGRLQADIGSGATGTTVRSLSINAQSVAAFATNPYAQQLLHDDYYCVPLRWPTIGPLCMRARVAGPFSVIVEFQTHKLLPRAWSPIPVNDRQIISRMLTVQIVIDGVRLDVPVGDRSYRRIDVLPCATTDPLFCSTALELCADGELHGDPQSVLEVACSSASKPVRFCPFDSANLNVSPVPDEAPAAFGAQATMAFPLAMLVGRSGTLTTHGMIYCADATSCNLHLLSASGMWQKMAQRNFVESMVPLSADNLTPRDIATIGEKIHARSMVLSSDCR